MSFEPVDCPQTPDSRAEQLETLLQDALGVRNRAAIPAKLGLPAATWQAFREFLAGQAPLTMLVRPVLSTVYGALRAVGAEDRYWRVMAGVRFPLDQAGVAWQRCLGPSSPLQDQLDLALDKLRLDTVGLTLRRRVAIAGEAVDWAIAGLLPTGEVMRLAILVRSPASPLRALREDLADDTVEAAGFELMAFRDWQLRYPGACALHVAQHLARRAEGLRLPARVLEPEDSFILQRIQAAPAVLTPRSESPNWAMREALRRAHPHLDQRSLLALYEDRVIERTIATSDGEEWTVWG